MQYDVRAATVTRRAGVMRAWCELVVSLSTVRVEQCDVQAATVMRRAGAI